MMPSIIDGEHMNVDRLPGVWCPVQWDMTPEERVQEVEEQARASLLGSIDVPEAILRLLLDETEVERAYEPPEGYDPTQQGEWDEELITFQFRRPIKLVSVDRKRDNLYVEYDFGDLGHWAMEIGPEEMHLQRV